MELTVKRGVCHVVQRAGGPSAVPMGGPRGGEHPKPQPCASSRRKSGFISFSGKGSLVGPGEWQSPGGTREGVAKIISVSTAGRGPMGGPGQRYRRKEYGKSLAEGCV